MAIASDNTLSMLKTTYDEDLANFAPGRLLLRHVIEQAYALHPGKRIEFCTDADADLLAWATSHRRIEHWSFFRGPLPQALYDLGRMLQNMGRLGASASNGNPPTVDIHHSVDHLPADALELLRAQELDSLQLGADWLRNLERTVFPSHDGLRYFVLRDKGAALVVMPTVAEPSRLGTRVRSLANFYTALHSPAMQPWVKPQTLVPLLRSIFKHHAPVRSLRLDPMDPDSVAFKTLSEALRIAGIGTFAYFCFGNWALSPAGGWKAYLATRSANLRSSVKRMTNRLIQAGGRLEVVTQMADLERGLAAYHRVYSSSWKVPEPFGDFMPNLFRLCAARGAMRLGIAWLHDVPIAAQIWIVLNGRAEIFKVAYDEAYKQYSPGTVVTALLMEHVLELDRVKEVDYLIGDDAYKSQWMSHRRERWGLVAYNPLSIAGLVGFTREAAGRAVKRVIGRP